MKSDHEALTAQFLRWEIRGRGWQAFDEPVDLEPPFRHFEGHYLPRRPQSEINAEGRLGSVFGNLFWKLRKSHSPTTEELEVAEGAFDDGEPEEPCLQLWKRENIVELQIALPSSGRFPRDRMESFLLLLSGCEDPVSFEIVANSSEVVVQFAASLEDAILLRKQIELHFPEFVVSESNNALLSIWDESGDCFEAAELALSGEFMMPLGTPKQSIFLGMSAAMSEMSLGELLVYQVLFQPVRHPWGISALESVSNGEGGGFFVNRQELLPAARLKMHRPLFAVAVKVAVVANTQNDVVRIMRSALGSLTTLARPGGNSLTPLANNRPDPGTLQDDLIWRHSHRLGMLLNIDELLSLAHFPDDSIAIPNLRLDTGRTRAAPSPSESEGLFLGWNDHVSQRLPVILDLEARVRHVHIIGASGTGKSNLLFNLISEDMNAGHGLTVIDPHGDLIDKILASVPSHRIGDVVLIDPSDEEFSVGFNVLSAEGDLEKNLLASDLVNIFQRLSTSWGDQMGSVLNYAILAFLENPRGGTLADLHRFLLESDFRNEILESVTDEHVVYYWRKGFPQLGGGKSVGPLLTRLGLFLSPKPIRYMIAQRENRLDCGRLMNDGKIILARLPQGRMGKENAFLLGSLIVSKLQQAAMARQRIPEANRRLHTLYVDEFQEFCTPSMAEILTGTRKYRLSLVLAHQSLDQIKRHDEVGGAVLANAGTRIVFRVSDSDARELERGFEHFDASALQTLSEGEAIARIGRRDADFNLSIPLAEPLPLTEAAARKQAVVEASRETYGKSRAQIEAELTRKVNANDLAADQPPKKKPKTSNVTTFITEPEPVTPSTQPVEVTPASTVVEEPPTVIDTASTKLQEIDAETHAYSPPSVKTAVEALGRGGQLHQAAQLEIKRVAESLGFQALTESQPLGSKSFADLVLKRESRCIACEISVTNATSAEMEKFGHHLRAGDLFLAVICLVEKKLSTLEKAVKNTISKEQLPNVGFYLKDDFLTYLQSVAMTPTSSKSETKESGGKKHKGWKVTTSSEEVGEEEARHRANEIAATLAASLSKKPRRKKKNDSAKDT